MCTQGRSFLNRNDSPLYGVIISLEKQDKYIADDGDSHSDEHSYSAVIDKRITANGFRMRWRKGTHTRMTHCRPFTLLLLDLLDSYSHDLIVQFTAISDLNGYGPADCVELLEIIGQAPHSTLKRARPKKIVDFFVKKVKTLADISCEHASCERMLASLDQETQDLFDTMIAAPVHSLM